MHTVNEEHVAIAPLRALLDPLASLTDVVRDAAGQDVHAVVLFGSTARGESGPGSDVNLAVIASPAWAHRVELEDAVRNRLGNRCEVVHLTPEDWTAAESEPVVAEIRRDGVALVGAMPTDAVVGHA